MALSVSRSLSTVTPCIATFIFIDRMMLNNVHLSQFHGRSTRVPVKNSTVCPISDSTIINDFLEDALFVVRTIARNGLFWPLTRVHRGRVILVFFFSYVPN